MKLIQMTDCHLSKTTNHSFEASLAECVKAIVPIAPDAVVATGDIADDGSCEAYDKFTRITQPLGKKCYWSPGNHDDREEMERVLGHSVTKSFKLDNWVIVLLDTSIPNEIPGRIGASQLDWLNKLLAEEQSSPTAIFMHHHPAPVGCLWIDSQTVEDAGLLASIIRRHKQVKFISNGHVHQEKISSFAGVPWYTAPATSRQFSTHSDDFSIDTTQVPGFRVFDLTRDGDFQTYIKRIG